MELCEASQCHPPPSLSVCTRRASMASWPCQRHPSFFPSSCKFCQKSWLSFPAPASVSIKQKRNFPKHISHMINREKLKNVMASAGNTVNASWFLSTYKSTGQGLPQAPCSPWHVAQSCCSSFIQQLSSDHASSFPAEKASIKTGKQQYSLAPGILCV